MGLLTNKFQDNVIVEKLDKLLSWSRSTSPWFFQFGTACCAIEMMAAAASRHDMMRIGAIPRSSPRTSRCYDCSRYGYYENGHTCQETLRADG